MGEDVVLLLWHLPLTKRQEVFGSQPSPDDFLKGARLNGKSLIVQTILKVFIRNCSIQQITHINTNCTAQESKRTFPSAWPTNFWLTHFCQFHFRDSDISVGFRFRLISKIKIWIIQLLRKLLLSWWWSEKQIKQKTVKGTCIN